MLVQLLGRCSLNELTIEESKEDTISEKSVMPLLMTFNFINTEFNLGRIKVKEKIILHLFSLKWYILSAMCRIGIQFSHSDYGFSVSKLNFDNLIMRCSKDYILNDEGIRRKSDWPSADGKIHSNDQHIFGWGWILLGFARASITAVIP